MDPDIGDSAARRDNLFAELEHRWNTHRLDRRIYTAPAGHLLDRFSGFAVGAVDARGGAEAIRRFKPVVVQINHVNLGWREELRGKQRCQPNWPETDDRNCASRLNLPVQDATLEAGRQDVAQHHQRLFV